MENETTLTADYLVIGSGAMGMAFTDVLIQETDASVVMVDRHHRPGGHWNDSYAYVRLHQPSSFYGVNSRHLGSDAVDQTGWNKGLHELGRRSLQLLRSDYAAAISPVRSCPVLSDVRLSRRIPV